MMYNPLSGDAENVMTPNRRAAILRRLDAERRIREQRRATAHLRSHGALPPDHPAHHRACALDCYNLAGILFADGAVHLFDRDDIMHMDYAWETRRTMDIESGASSGDDGWAFYVYRGGDVEPYMLPEPFVPAVEEVVSALLS